MRPIDSMLKGWGAGLRAGVLAALALFSLIASADYPDGVTSDGNTIRATYESTRAYWNENSYVDGSTYEYQNRTNTGCTGPTFVDQASQFRTRNDFICTYTATRYQINANGTKSNLGTVSTNKTFSVYQCYAGRFENWYSTGTMGCGTVMCPTGTDAATGILYQDSNSPINDVCVRSCVVTRYSGGSGTIGQIEKDGRWYGGAGESNTVWRRTGAACPGEGDGNTTQTTNKGTVTTEKGTTYSVGSPSAQCGLVNGEKFCADAAPAAGSCVTTASGAAFCTTPVISPPAPKNTQTGAPVAPDAEIATGAPGGTGTQTINYYNPVTVTNNPPNAPNQGSTTGGTTGTTSGTTGGTTGTTSGTTSGSTGGTTSGTTGGTGGSCGGPDQPLCGVKVDETGTPTGVPDEFGRLIDPANVEQYSTNLDAKAGELAGAYQSIFSGILDNINRATSFDTECQSVDMTIAGKTKQIPGVLGCNFLSQAKAIASWILGLLVALSVFVTLKESIK